MVSKKNTKKNVKRKTLKSKKSRRVPLRKSKRSTKVGKRANKKYQKGGAAALTVPKARPQVRADGTVRVTKDFKYSGHGFYDRKPIENWLNTYLTTYTKGYEGFDNIMLEEHYNEYSIRKEFVENFVKNHAEIIGGIPKDVRYDKFEKIVSNEPSLMGDESDETHIKNVDIKKVQRLLRVYGIFVDQKGNLRKLI